MNQKELCGRIFALDQSIRFAGVLSGEGRLVEGGMREGLKPLEDEIHEKRWFNQVAIRREMTTMFDKMYGRLSYVFADRERVKQLTFYFGDYILIVSMEPQVSAHHAMDIASSILDFAKS